MAGGALNVDQTSVLQRTESMESRGPLLRRF